MYLLAQYYSHSRSCRKKKESGSISTKKRAVKENSHSASTHSDFFCQVRSSSRGEDLRDQRLGACPGT